MYLILFVLHDPSYLKEILDAWHETGVTGITILPSTGLGRLSETSILRDDMPLIPSLSDLLAHDEVLNRTLFTVVKDDSMVEKIVEATEAIIGNFNDPNTGILTVLPISKAYGLDRNLQ